MRIEEYANSPAMTTVLEPPQKPTCFCHSETIPGFGPCDVYNAGCRIHRPIQTPYVAKNGHEVRL